MRSDADRLDDILEAIDKIKKRIPSDVEPFLGDEMMQVWCVHNLQTIGEACRCMSQALRDVHPEVPWPQIMALRNILVHEYFGLNLRQIWTMIQTKLEAQIRQIRSHMTPGPAVL